jgi:hypothetical protein
MADKQARLTTPLPPGTSAPDFRLHDTPDQAVSPSDFRGRPVVLAFYPADWSPVCSDQMVLYQELMPEFQSTMPSCSESPSTASCATWPSPRTGRSSFRCSRTSSRRERYPAPIGPTGRGTATASERAVLHRSRGLDLLQLPVARRREPGRRWHPLRARRPGEPEESVMTTVWQAVLTLPAAPRRDHIRGPGNAPAMLDHGQGSPTFHGSSWRR